MGYWKKHYFSDKKTAQGFRRGVKFAGYSVLNVRKRKRKYFVEVKH